MALGSGHPQGNATNQSNVSSLSANQESEERCIIPEDIDISTHEFVIPKKEISNPDDIKTKWEKSEAYHHLLGFISAMSEAVKNKKLRDPVVECPVITNLLELLDTLDVWVNETPPIQQPQRFGNKAFRTWFDRLKQNAESLVLKAIGEKFAKAVPEISLYLVESVGNSTRIDYGTGHELAFVAFLCCLFKIGALQQEHSCAAVLKVFERYLVLIRNLQKTYTMEPAGSHGVWSLDDYQFIPFIWGSSQLLDHKRLLPKSYPEPDMAASFTKDYMFMGCIHYINQVKTGPFAEHSNQLWNISGVKTWSKVNSGLMKMYKVEVLSKHPVIQHFLFGSLLSIKPVT